MTNQADWHALGVGTLVDNQVQLNWGAGCDNMTNQADWHTLGVEILVDRQVRLKLDSKSNWHTNRHKPKLRTNKQINSQWVHFECCRISLYPHPMATGLGFFSPVRRRTNRWKCRGNLHQANHTDNLVTTKLIYFHIMQNKCGLG